MSQFVRMLSADFSAPLTMETSLAMPFQAEPPGLGKSVVMAALLPPSTPEHNRCVHHS